MAMLDILKRSIKFPMSVDEEVGTVQYYEDFDESQKVHAADIIKQLILIGQNEVLFEPDGSDVANMIFEPDSEKPEDYIKFSIGRTLDRDVRIKLVKSEFVRDRNKGETKLQITYKVPTTDKKEVVTINI